MQPSQYPDYGSHGGHASFDTSGAGVAAGMHWDAVHDPSALGAAAPDSWALTQYWRQLHNLTHEVEHIFGAGCGEYYNLRQVSDRTGVAPLREIYFDSLAPLADPYWAARTDYHTDPLFSWQAYGHTYAQIMEGVRFARVTAAVINGPNRTAGYDSRSLPDLSRTKIAVTAGGGQPVAGAAVKAWKVRNAGLDETATLLFEGTTGADGTVQFAWPGAFNNYDFLLLVKAYPPGGGDGVALHYSIFDAQEQKLVYGRNELVIPVSLDGSAPPPLPSVSAGDAAAVAEGDTGAARAATFAVTLSEAPTRTVTVDYSAQGGTATAGVDFAAAAGTLTFAPGETSKTVTVLVNGDLADEADETFAVQLGNAAGAVIADGQGAGTILDDDPLALSIADVAELEGASTRTLLVTVRLNKPGTGRVTVKYATAAGSARARSDFASASGTLTFNPGETVKTVAVTIYGDGAREPDEAFTVNLSRASGAALADGSATVTLRNDDL